MKKYGILFSYSALGIIALASISLVACGKSSSNPFSGNLGVGGDTSIFTSGNGGDTSLGGTEGQFTVGGSGAIGGASGGQAGGSGIDVGGAGGSVTEPFDSGASDGTVDIPLTGGDGGAGGDTTQSTLGPVNLITGTEPVPAGCQGLQFPEVTDYTILPPNGPFETTEEDNTGPGGAFTLFRPTNLDAVPLHPIATWGNGIMTTPAAYVPLLSTFAASGFVVIASNSTGVNTSMMTQGLDWLIQQNSAGGEFQGKLATQCALSIGYSLGGGAAISTGAHASVVATIHMHGLSGSSGALHGPLLVMTSTDDTFVSSAGNAVPTYNACTQPAILATELPLTPVLQNNGHLRPLNDAEEERAPALAWARLWMYGDSGAKKYFFGDGCLLCQSPWTGVQRKNYTW